MRGTGPALGSGQFAGLAQYTHDQLEAEIRKLTAEDPELLAAARRLMVLQQAYEQASQGRRAKR